METLEISVSVLIRLNKNFHKFITLLHDKEVIRFPESSVRMSQSLAQKDRQGENDHIYFVGL